MSVLRLDLLQCIGNAVIVHDRIKAPEYGEVLGSLVLGSMHLKPIWHRVCKDFDKSMVLKLTCHHKADGYSNK